MICYRDKPKRDSSMEQGMMDRLACAWEGRIPAANPVHSQRPGRSSNFQGQGGNRDFGLRTIPEVDTIFFDHRLQHLGESLVPKPIIPNGNYHPVRGPCAGVYCRRSRQRVLLWDMWKLGVENYPPGKWGTDKYTS